MSTDKLVEVPLRLSDPGFRVGVSLTELLESLKANPSGIPTGDTNYGKLNGSQVYISSSGSYQGMKEYLNGVEDGQAVIIGPNNAVKSEGRFEKGECICLRLFKDGIIYSWEKDPKSGFSYKLEDPEIKYSIQFNVDENGYGSGKSLITNCGEQKLVTLKEGFIQTHTWTWLYWTVVCGIVIVGGITGIILWKKYWFSICSTHKPQIRSCVA